ncbi:PREDICTED: uncharacterized protein LOC108559240 [Nicrophorus vespilloides]|uniref:Uncharacterized protein LOC108559240 n=1 Tax=Nicrophorus vespilloides TaxID=110193 RepID=A0ABM1MBI9_NICVS|nr:PREDICTED: uncharacterized protein LOC108559240 [Nicrophorus vespilloides]
MAFSLTKNLERLGSEITSEDGLALAPIQGIRVFNIFFVVMCHSCVLLFVGPIANPQYAENVTLDPLNMFLSNGNLIMQTSFMISALLLSFHLCQIFENMKMNVSVIFMGIVNRLLRLYPIHLAMLGFAATWLRHSGNGPFFHRIVDSEFRNCRENWLLNVLFINNLYNTENICMTHSWYLSADTQLFVFGLFVMMVVINNPRKANTIFISLFVTGILVTFAQHYYNAYDIVFRSYPEYLYNLFLNLPFWHSLYIATHNQIPCYVMGLATGFYIHKWKKEKVKIALNNFWYTIWFIYSWVAPIGTILSAAPFYEDGFSTTRLNSALYNAFFRLSFGLPILIAIIMFIFGQGRPMLNFINWRPFHVLGRLTFGVYLMHLHILRMNIGVTRTLHHVTHRSLIRWVFGDITICFLMATIVCLLIELPASAIQKVLLSTEKKTEGKAKNQ